MDEIADRFQEIVSKFETKIPIKMPVLLRQICDLYGLKQAAYFGINRVKPEVHDPYLAVTYSEDWMKHYREMDYVFIDPVVGKGLTALLPIDWAQFRNDNKRVASFFGNAADYGIGNNGITIPIRGHALTRAVFSVTSDLPDREWQSLSVAIQRDFQLIAYYLHQRVEQNENLIVPTVRLAPREIECLKWKSAGKTADQIADILNISERTVHFYIGNAVVKLDAHNATHAVTKAISQNLFYPEM
ncbi:LuxR family transcriptional regulator [Martelella alba]|uniref:LuxR family transcriptional regulator n=1 Tax=Martelella alba TaxID=2590451 RepID=A0A506TZ50_9HYPH|nr:LuxR family transcriptional regulator [Martelella alba]TPW27362.1 LuxR family transcriptional regulator [Martelella alba]